MTNASRRFFRRKEDRLPPSANGPHRFISRDGRANIMKQGLSRHQPIDWNHYLLSIHWLVLLGWASLVYVGINSLFALLYLLEPQGIVSSARYPFFDAFFFSVQVFSTLGFSQHIPSGFYAHFLVTIESFIGWCSYGIIIGLLFSRFTRPHSPVIFSQAATIAPYEGHATLQIRTANKRGNKLLQAQAHLTLSRNEKTLEGDQTRRVYDLKLIRSTLSLFNLTWTLRHVIDSNSPLYNETPESLKERETELVVLLSGVDDTFGQAVHTHFAYNFEEILFGYRFKNMFTREEGHRPTIDFSQFDEVEPV